MSTGGERRPNGARAAPEQRPSGARTSPEERLNGPRARAGPERRPGIRSVRERHAIGTISACTHTHTVKPDHKRTCCSL